MFPGDSSSSVGASTVFLSYVRSEFDPLPLEAALKKRGVTLVFDQQDIRAGKDWTHELRRLVEQCPFFLAAWTASYSKSEMCQWELEVARQYSRSMLMLNVLGENEVLQMGTAKGLQLFKGGKRFSIEEDSVALVAELHTDPEWEAELRLYELMADRHLMQGSGGGTLLTRSMLRPTKLWRERTPPNRKVPERINRYLAQSSIHWKRQFILGIAFVGSFLLLCGTVLLRG
jgi:hypothetical protein